jgi:hypothetical protein
MSERKGASGAIGRILLDELKEIFGYWKKFKNAELTRLELQAEAKSKTESIFDALSVGASAEQIGNKSQALCCDLLNRFSTLWTFLEQEGVEPTNGSLRAFVSPRLASRYAPCFTISAAPPAAASFSAALPLNLCA